MKPARIFNVSPSLPKSLSVMQELAYNLRWSWEHETIDLFRRTDRDLWERVYQNPVKLLGTNQAGAPRRGIHRRFHPQPDGALL